MFLYTLKSALDASNERHVFAATMFFKGLSVWTFSLFVNTRCKTNVLL